MNNITINGIIAVRTSGSVLSAVEVIFDTIVYHLATNTKNSTLWIDDGISVSSLVLLGDKIRQYASAQGLSDDWINDCLDRVQYTECRTLNALLDYIAELKDKSNCLIVILNVYDMFNSLKLTSFNQAHLLINEILVKLRKEVLHNEGVILLDCDDRMRNFMDAYVDRRYRLVRGEMEQM